MTFTALIEPRRGGGVRIRLPFDPDEAWGTRERHSIHGTIQERGVRGAITRVDGQPVLDLGPSWCRDPEVAAGTTATIELAPEGPQLDSMAPDIAAAIVADPEARRFFESLASFYRNNFERWIESAKRPETRAKRIAETVVALRESRRER